VYRRNLEEISHGQPRDREARAHFGAVGAAPGVGGVGSFDEPAAAFLFDRPAFEGIDAGAIVEHGSVLHREHEGEHARRLRRVGGIGRTEFEVEVVVVDFEKELVSRQVETAEVVLSVRIVIGVEAVERGDLSDCHRADVARQGVDTGRQHDAAERWIEGLPKGVVEIANAFARLVVSERHLLLREIDASPWRVERRGGAFRHCTYRERLVEGSHEPALLGVTVLANGENACTDTSQKGYSPTVSRPQAWPSKERAPTNRCV
jgi:hypothetical protein